MKTIRYTHIVLVVVLLLTACTSAPTVEPTTAPTLIRETSTPTGEIFEPTTTSVSVVTTPLPVSQRTALPPTSVPGLPVLPEDVGSNSCPGTQPSMLMPGHQGRVSNATPDPNRVRAEPNAQADLLGEIPAGAYFDVLEGPHCADDSAWFRVRYESIEGWMKEGSSSEYWVMPIVDDARILTGPSIVAAGYNINLPEVLGTSAQILDLPYDATDNTPPVTFLRLTEYRFYDYSASIFIYNVEEYLYYRADLRSRLEGIRTSINSLLSDPDAQIGWPEFRDPFIQEQTYLIQAGRFSYGWGLRGVSVMEDDPSTPYYVFLGFTSDMQSLFYVKLPIRQTFGQFAENNNPDNFSPTITQVDTLLLFQPYTTHSSLSDPTLAGTCPGAPPFTLMVGDWARVSVDPPAPSRIRSGPSSNNQVLGEAQPGENLLVIDGPQCANGYTWWKVRSLAGLEGWVAEGDAEAYWLVEPISAWYQLPTPVDSGNLVSYSLGEININVPNSLVEDFAIQFFPLATPMPTPASVETPWPDDPRANIYTSAGHAHFSYYGIVSNTLSYSFIRVYDIQDPLSQYYVNNLAYGGCTDMLRDNLQNDPPIESYIISFCGIGGGIPVDFIVDVLPIQFTGGRGLRFLLSSGNYLTTGPLNYIFQGLSDDGRYYIVALLRDINHPYIVDSNLLMEGDFGPLIGWGDGQYDEAEASYDVFNERMETLLDAQVVTLYPQLSILDEMMASIEIK